MIEVLTNGNCASHWDKENFPYLFFVIDLSF